MQTVPSHGKRPYPEYLRINIPWNNQKVHMNIVLNCSKVRKYYLFPSLRELSVKSGFYAMFLISGLMILIICLKNVSLHSLTV